MMTNMQNISSQLMKSPRELASWNFPLSQILEEYFKLLPEPCKIHYGEAALVIQNSVNAYVRRVEELYDETRCLSQKIVVESNVNDEKHFQKEQKSKRCLIDFSQFELLDFDKEIGKNINLKNHESKSIKFLHRCFSQLENSYEKLHIQIFDIQSETIGKKYNFRCNQHITKNGTLVEEFTPKNFENILIHESNRYQLNALSKRNTKINKSSNCFLNESKNEYERQSNECITVTFDNKISSNLNFYVQPKENFQSSTVQDSGCFALYHSESHQTKNLTIVNGLNQILPQFHPNEDIDKEVYDFEDNLSNSDTFNDCHSLNFTTNSTSVNLQVLDEYIKDVSIQKNQNKHETKENKSNTKLKNQELGKENDIEENNITKCDYKRRNSENINNDSNDVLNNTNCLLRRSKRLKQTKDNLNNYILDGMNLLKPIPFKDGIPEKLIKTRKEFRLPCHINLLRRTQPKRKVIKSKNKLLEQSIKVTFQNNNDKSESADKNMKMTMYSPSRQQFITMKEEDLNGYQRSLDERFNIKHRFAVKYDPVTTLTMDLLGFHLNYSKESNSHLTLSERMTASDTNLLSPQCTPRSSPLLDDFSSQISPSLNFLITKRNFNEKEKIRIKSIHNFEKLVKHKIKMIYEELDLQSDEDQNVAKWHEEIKPRLMEAERKPPFLIHEYESRIIQRLETCDRKLKFDEIVCKEPPCEIARYFSATLQLASTNNLNINTNKDFNKSIELVLVD